MFVGIYLTVVFLVFIAATVLCWRECYGRAVMVVAALVILTVVLDKYAPVVLS